MKNYIEYLRNDGLYRGSTDYIRMRDYMSYSTSKWPPQKVVTPNFLVDFFKTSNKNEHFKNSATATLLREL